MKDKQEVEEKPSDLAPEIMHALHAQAKREVDMIVTRLRRISAKELADEKVTAEINADHRMLGVIKALEPITAKRENDRLLFASRRACEACERSGTPQQLADEKERLEVYVSAQNGLAAGAVAAEKDLPAAIDAMLETWFSRSVARKKRQLREEHAA